MYSPWVRYCSRPFSVPVGFHETPPSSVRYRVPLTGAVEPVLCGSGLHIQPFLTVMKLQTPQNLTGVVGCQFKPPSWVL